ncbi:MAG: hypothetical protein ACK42C_02815, partial [Aquificaceae bacterium]
MHGFTSFFYTLLIVRILVYDHTQQVASSEILEKSRLLSSILSTGSSMKTLLRCITPASDELLLQY